MQAEAFMITFLLNDMPVMQVCRISPLPFLPMHRPLHAMGVPGVATYPHHLTLGVYYWLITARLPCGSFVTCTAGWLFASLRGFL